MTITAVGAAVANGAAAGTSPPAPSLGNGTDQRGAVRLGSGTATTTGTLCTLTLGASYTGIDNSVLQSVGLMVRLMPLNAATDALGIYVASIANARTITIGCKVAPTASQSLGTYAFTYEIGVR